MAKKKNGLILRATRDKVYNHGIELGMKPYNAAITAGFTVKQAEHIQKMSNILDVGMRDIAERSGFTPKTLIAHLIERSGFLDREKGAKRVIAATVQYMDGEEKKFTKMSDFVEVPDDKTQFQYLEQLLQLCDYVGKKGTVEGGASTEVRPFMININVLGDDGRTIRQLNDVKAIDIKVADA